MFRSWHVKVFSIVFAVIIIKTNNAFVTRNISIQQQSLQQQQVRNVGTTTTTKWHAQFTPNTTTINMKTSDNQVFLLITEIDTSQKNYYFRLVSENNQLSTVDQVIHPTEINPITSQWNGPITIQGIFIGSTKIYVERVDTSTNAVERSQESLEVIIVRETRVIDHIFTGSVATLVSVLYINFGAALDLSLLRGILSRPVGPAIGFLTQFLLMPLLSYGLGLAIFPSSPEMQLGLFFTGVSPAGGASNMWTVILGGNINLSVLMTTIGNFAAFFMMPLWLFTLGQTIFDKANMTVPYRNIATYCIALVVPLCIGLAIQRCSPKVTRLLVRLLKPISTILILFIVIFAIVTNLYIFQLFSWQIVLAGLALPWLGYLIAWFVAKACRQNPDDSLTIAIETGIQNTGIAIFLLRFSLGQPQADLTTVMPVAVAIMTPFPLLALYIYRRFIVSQTVSGISENTRIVTPLAGPDNHSNIS